MSVAGGGGGAFFIASGRLLPRLSAAGWINGALEPNELATGRGSWGRESELDEEPTLLHDSEPEERREENIYFLHFLDDLKETQRCVSI